ncbi:hypothetical protein PUN28_018152 [Cardiocondyla obscurior]|uniref:Uncharacterized protein n=1 Tax=Cardiocondyla obscurior TaxID=286306 RepID=A0AAW2EI85_9HYME
MEGPPRVIMRFGASRHGQIGARIVYHRLILATCRNILNLSPISGPRVSWPACDTCPRHAHALTYLRVPTTRHRAPTSRLALGTLRTAVSRTVYTDIRPTATFAMDSDCIELESTRCAPRPSSSRPGLSSRMTSRPPNNLETLSTYSAQLDFNRKKKKKKRAILCALISIRRRERIEEGRGTDEPKGEQVQTWPVRNRIPTLKIFSKSLHLSLEDRESFKTAYEFRETASGMHRSNLQ